MRWFVAETLRAEGAATYEAADGDSALRLLAAHPGAVQVVLLDLSLPDCTDLRLLRAIRRLTPAPVVIMMTAFGSPEIRREALSLGVKAFLDKPFEMSDLPGIIERCLAGDSIK